MICRELKNHVNDLLLKGLFHLGFARSAKLNITVVTRSACVLTIMCRGKIKPKRRDMEPAETVPK